MRKRAALFVAFGLLLGISGLCHAAYIVRVRTQCPAASYLPQRTINRQKKFKNISDKVGEPCKHYKNVDILQSQNTGRIWPKQRRKLLHKIVSELERSIKSFPSINKKRKAINNLEKRISYLE